MTPAQENLLHQQQIQGDAARRAMAYAANSGPYSPLLLTDIANNDAARQAAGQTIEWDSESKLAAGMIPGTSGLTVQPPQSGLAAPVKVTASGTKPPPRHE
jgi:hypothetical protein